MALTRDQFDVIANSYNDRQLNNKIKLNRRIEEVYEKIPLIKDLDGQIGVLAGRALDFLFQAILLLRTHFVRTLPL